MRRILGLAGLSLVLAGPAMAQDMGLLPVDISQPMEIRARAPLCETDQDMRDSLLLVMQGAVAMAVNKEGCFALRRNTRVYFLEERGELPLVRYRVRWTQSNGRPMEAWTAPFFLQNVAPAADPARPRRRG